MRGNPSGRERERAATVVGLLFGILLSGFAASMLVVASLMLGGR